MVGKWGAIEGLALGSVWKEQKEAGFIQSKHRGIGLCSL